MSEYVEALKEGHTIQGTTVCPECGEAAIVKIKGNKGTVTCPLPDCIFSARIDVYLTHTEEGVITIWRYERDRMAILNSLCTQMYDLLCWVERDKNALTQEDLQALLNSWYPVKADYDSYLYGRATV